jgi:hypothetical protein
MLAALLDLIPKPLYAAGVALLLAMLGLTQYELITTKTDLALEKEHAAELVTTIAEADRAAQKQRADNAEAARKAEQDRVAREKVLAADAASARSALERLRSSLTGAGLRPNPSGLYPSFKPADTADDLLTVSSSYIELAEKCDRHVSDIQTLVGAWPK